MPNFHLISCNNNFFSVSKEIATIAMPLAGDYFLATCVDFFKAFTLTNAGGNYLAASILIFPIELLLSFAVEWSYAALQIFFVQAFQERDVNKLNVIFIQSYIFSVLLCVVVVPLLVALGPMLRAFGSSKETASIIGEYFSFLAIGFPASLVLYIQQQFFISTNNENITFYIKLWRTSLDIGFIALFLYILKLPASTIALAFSLEKTIVAIASSFYINFSKRFNSLVMSVPFVMDKTLLTNISCQQIPILLNSCVQLSILLADNVLIGAVSGDAAQAFQTSAEFTDWIVNPAYALGAATCVVESKALIDHNLSINSILMSGFFWSQVLPVLGLCAALIFSRNIAQLLLYSDHEESQQTINTMVWVLPVRVVLVALESLNQVIEGALRGFKKSHYATYSSLIGAFGVGLSLTLLAVCALNDVRFAIASIIVGALATVVANSFFYIKERREVSRREAGDELDASLLISQAPHSRHFGAVDSSLGSSCDWSECGELRLPVVID